MPNSVCLWRKCYFFFDVKLCLLKIAIRREKFDKKVSENGAVWETEIRSTIGLIFSDVTGCTERAWGRVYCIVVYCFPIQLIALKIFISRKMEENTLELSFEVDVSEGDEEKDRNYSLDSDNDDRDFGDFDPEAGENQVPRCRWHVSV